MTSAETDFIWYIERVAEFNWRSSGPPILLVASVSCPYTDFVASSSVDLLRDQRHNIPHEFVQIEGHDKSRPRHFPCMPKTLSPFAQIWR